MPSCLTLKKVVIKEKAITEVKYFLVSQPRKFQYLLLFRVEISCQLQSTYSYSVFINSESPFWFENSECGDQGWQNCGHTSC